MSGIFTREAINGIQSNEDLTPEQRTDQIFSLFGKAINDGYMSLSAVEEAKNKAVESAKAEIKIPEPVDPKTTPEYMEVMNERDMLRAIGGEDFSIVKPKFREQVYGMLQRGENAPAVAEQLKGIRESFEEFFTPAESPKEPQSKNTPVYSQNPSRAGVNPESDEEKLLSQIRKSWN